jgi:hypothetical protein
LARIAGTKRILYLKNTRSAGSVAALRTDGGISDRTVFGKGKIHANVIHTLFSGRRGGKPEGQRPYGNYESSKLIQYSLEKKFPKNGKIFLTDLK